MSKERERNRDDALPSTCVLKLTKAYPRLRCVIASRHTRTLSSGPHWLNISYKVDSCTEGSSSPTYRDAELGNDLLEGR